MLVKINTARFLTSSQEVAKCPPPNRPEYAFIGRSNVGKSSVINMLTNHKALAKTSSTPGKTRLINHFLINESWYIVDLPGYGFAKVPKAEREKWEKSIREYVSERVNLCCLFILLDIRHEALNADLDFMTWAGENRIPFALIFTKADKIRPEETESAVRRYLLRLEEIFEPLPEHFVSSAIDFRGKMEMLEFIDKINREFYASV